MNDEYELFPLKVLEDLKYDVEALKKKLSEPDTMAQELVAEIGDLKSAMKELNNIFKEALVDIKDEDSGKLLAALQNQIESVTTQNETIARGMIAISDKLEEFMKKSPAPARSAVIQRAPPIQSGPPRMPSGPPMPPGPPSIPPPSMDAPPMPPPKPKRTGIFK